MQDLSEFFESVSRTSKFPCYLGETGGYINFQNSGQRGGVKEFTLSLSSLLSGLKDIRDNIEYFSNISNYVEIQWRDAGQRFSDLALKSTITVQTKPCFTALSKIISWANQFDGYDDSSMVVTQNALDTAIQKTHELIESYKTKVCKTKRREISSVVTESFPLPKPFLLLAGISGTGKSRFIRQQAERHPSAQQQIIPVRPDWHEPSDLLGYVSRLSATGEEYIVTDALRFMLQAWQAVFDGGAVLDEGSVNGERDCLKSIPPFWLGLDEMNLAPVEQYFSDYLSVIESRNWAWDGDEFTYSCEPLLCAENCKLIRDKDLRESLSEALWLHIEKYGMAIPFNLIVAGTVNMDETTHGFSRKVIDRALTIDFGEFSPNGLDNYFEAKTEPKLFSYPTLSYVRKRDLDGTADSDGSKSIEFFSAINNVLKDTPFELAYRALNELLISVVCENSQNDEELYAVWDDFLMTKVLPRIEGDMDKLQTFFGTDSENSVPALLKAVKGCLAIEERKDLFLQKVVGEGRNCTTPLRSPKKIEKMIQRLESSGFTSFWP